MAGLTNNIEVKFIEMREEHLPLVREIYDYYVQNTAATFHIGEVSIADLKEFIHIAHPRYKSYLITREGEIYGYAYLTHFKKREAYDRTAEVTVYLKPERTGKGVGRAALNYLENEAMHVGIKVLIATISGTNHQSMHVFENQGYICCGHYKEVGEKFGEILDVFTYQKILSQ
jgi:L-amino acid N-acyltransferase YncA